MLDRKDPISNITNAAFMGLASFSGRHFTICVTGHLRPMYGALQISDRRVTHRTATQNQDPHSMLPTEHSSQCVQPRADVNVAARDGGGANHSPRRRDPQEK